MESGQTARLLSPQTKEERTVDQGEDFPASNTSCDAGSTCKTLRKALCFRLQATASLLEKGQVGKLSTISLARTPYGLMTPCPKSNRGTSLRARLAQIWCPAWLLSQSPSNSVQSHVLQHARFPVLHYPLEFNQTTLTTLYLLRDSWFHYL